LNEEILDRARKIKMLVLDCDGVLTDGRLILLPGGEETKAFDIKDGHAMRMAPRVGLRISIISGNRSFAVRERAEDLQVAHLYEGALTKVEPYEKILSAEDLTDEEMCYVGDDVIDIPVLRRAGLAVAVADAVEEVKRFSHFVTKRAGGRGAVREVIEMILKAQGRWDEALARYIT
jgi:3-deoxy-D-manno-octulosonate 8-phosphate phosphatase (KDO 8-P phosphatase)